MKPDAFPVRFFGFGSAWIYPKEHQKCHFVYAITTLEVPAWIQMLLQAEKIPPALRGLPLSGDLGGRAKKHHQKMNYHYQKDRSLPCTHIENSDLRWKRHKHSGVCMEKLLCQILGSFQKVVARKPSHFLDGNHIFETKIHQSPKSGLGSAFAAIESSPSSQVSYCPWH